MGDAEAFVNLVQLPKDVLFNIVERCGPREKGALFLTCHSARRLVLEAVQQISISTQLSQLVKKQRSASLVRILEGCWLPSVKLKLAKGSLSGLLHASGQLDGIKHLELVSVVCNGCKKQGPAGKVHP
jgi:hypothetical protein